METASLIVGRFQPPHPGHIALAHRAKNVVVIYAVVVGPITSWDKDHNPLDFHNRYCLLDQMFKWSLPTKRSVVIWCESADLSMIVRSCPDFKIDELLCGDDRLSSFTKQAEDYGMSVPFIQRKDVHDGISASLIRDIIRSNNSLEDARLALRARFYDNRAYCGFLGEYIELIRRPWPLPVVFTQPIESPAYGHNAKTSPPLFPRALYWLSGAAHYRSGALKGFFIGPNNGMAPWCPNPQYPKEVVEHMEVLE